jgi:tRNA (guanine37-N1)-methyltransferase
MMSIEVVTIFPELFDAFSRTSIVGRGVDKGRVAISVHDLRRWTRDRHRSVDDYPYGGGAGMVMRVEPFIRCLDELAAQSPPPAVVLMSARGELFDQAIARELSLAPRLAVLCGHYKGVDERLVESVDREVSIGDYVLSGGEVPAMVVIDAVVRLLPGVVGDFASVEGDSHFEHLLSHPEYTRPRVFRGRAVPDVLLSGDHESVALWRQRQSEEVTRSRRPDLYHRYLEATGVRLPAADHLPAVGPPSGPGPAAGPEGPPAPYGRLPEDATGQETAGRAGTRARARARATARARRRVR